VFSRKRALQEARFAAQATIKAGFAAVGLHVRYSFQYPMAIEAKVLGRFFTSPADVRFIFDVGANIGQSALTFARDYPLASIHAFEPFAEVFAKLTSATGAEPRIRAVQAALGSRAQTLDTYFDGNASSQVNRITPASPDGPKAARVETIRVETLDAYCAANGIERIDVLKSDTEGHDVEVLRGATRMLREGRIKVIVVEAGFIHDQHHSPFETTSALLREHGFVVAGIYEATYLPNGHCDFCNVVYVRTSEL
jgi:FkbM family methyltransferase